MKRKVFKTYRMGMKKEGKSNEANENSANKRKFDADKPPRGYGLGSRTQRLFLQALAGSLTMDVLAILKGMNIVPDDLKVDIATNHPKDQKTTHLVFRFKGKNLDPDILKKAIVLSQEHPNDFIAMFGGFSNFTFEVQIE